MPSTDRPTSSPDGAADAGRRPRVLFVCVKNAGKSQMAAALTRHFARERLDVHSAGTQPGSAVNAESAAAVATLGATFDGEHPKAIDPAVLRTADRVIIVGSAARLEPIDGMLATIETWHTDEPSTRGIEGTERMQLIRDDIAERCRTLVGEMLHRTQG